MYNRLRTLYIFFLIAVCLTACHQDMHISPSQSSTFIKLYGGFNSEHAYAAEQTADGGYICLGSTDSFGNGGLDIYVIKTDKGGNKEWEKTIGGTLNDEGKSLQLLTDGSF